MQSSPFPWCAYGWITLGIVISVVLPILRGKLPKSLLGFTVDANQTWKEYVGLLEHPTQCHAVDDAVLYSKKFGHEDRQNRRQLKNRSGNRP